jgi:hypothetical protein
MIDCNEERSMTEQVFTREFAASERILDAEVELVLVERALVHEVAAFAAQVVRERRLPDVQDVVHAGTPASAQLGFDASLHDVPGFAAWCDDVDALVDAYALLVGAEEVGVRIATLMRPMCPRFHVDQIGCRLLTTYHGPGPEYLHDAEVNRALLGPGADGRPDERSGLLGPGVAIRRMPAGAVGWFKGGRWHEGQVLGVVHRSPPGDEPRLLLSLDRVS